VPEKKGGLGSVFMIILGSLVMLFGGGCLVLLMGDPIFRAGWIFLISLVPVVCGGILIGTGIEGWRPRSRSVSGKGHRGWVLMVIGGILLIVYGGIALTYGNPFFSAMGVLFIAGGGTLFWAARSSLRGG
jgi:hypothetical protein